MPVKEKRDKGFTLIEAILYIALFAIIIGGGMVAVYQIIQSTDATYSHIILQEEANFLFHKINWALTGATSVDAWASTLVCTKIISGTSTYLTFNLDNNSLMLQRDSFSPVTLNSGSIVVSNVSFEKLPDSVITNFTLTTAQNNWPATQDFSFTKYLR